MNPGYYFHIEPGESFIAGGIYMPPAEQLKAVRSYVADHGAEFLEVTNDKDFKEYFPLMYDDQLKTAPKGFPKDHEYIELLRYKSFIFSKKFTDKHVKSNDFIAEVVDAYRHVYPLNALLYQALE